MTEANTPAAPFRHDALLYSSLDDYLAGTVPFIRDGLEAGEQVLVVLAQGKLDAVRDALGTDGAHVQFADMLAVGRNPACIIPAWADFVAGSDRPVRGIGEPVWAERTPAELAEAQLHEALLNRAFAGRPGFWLRCPYDLTTLPPEVISAVQHSHPVPDDSSHATLAGRLPEPADVAERLEYDVGTLPAVRHTVRAHAERGGLDGARIRHLVLAVHEAAANSVRHGGGRGVLRIWGEGRALVCEVADRGHITDPLIGRVRPHPNAGSGRGLWIINQLCDLVQVRSSGAGTVVRMHQLAV
ncbi:MAG TPA: sensor histidine kinase [Mycobacteriales bacterium]